MKAVVVGLGSMGKRRIRCLKRLGVSDIVGFDPRSDRLEEASSKYDIQTVESWDTVKDMQVDAWIISTPPDTHIDYGIQAIEKGVSFFTEANVNDPRIDDLLSRLKNSKVVGAPSCTMRYYFGPRRIKELVEAGAVGRPLTFTYQSGQYLPDWHPWENYMDFYVSKRLTGACREIVPFELCWLIDIFGSVKSLSSMKDKLGDLEADIDDIYQLLLRFDKKVIGHLMVDVISRPAVRSFRLLGTTGTIEWDHSLNLIRYYNSSEDSWNEESLVKGTIEDDYIHAEEPYVDEIADFLAAIRHEKPWPYSFTEDEQVLSLLLRAETSNERGIHT